MKLMLLVTSDYDGATILIGSQQVKNFVETKEWECLELAITDYKQLCAEINRASYSEVTFNEVRENAQKYIDGDITESEMMGALTDLLIGSYEVKNIFSFAKTHNHEFISHDTIQIF